MNVFIPGSISTISTLSILILSRFASLTSGVNRIEVSSHSTKTLSGWVGSCSSIFFKAFLETMHTTSELFIRPVENDS